MDPRSPQPGPISAVDGVVFRRRPRHTTPPARRAAIAAAALLDLVALFQVAVAAGAPWGDATQGGRAHAVNGVLPAGARFVAALGAVVLGTAGCVLLARAGVIGTPLHPRTLRLGGWAVAGVLTVNTLANVAGKHPVERWGMALVSGAAAVLAALVAARGREATGVLSEGSATCLGNTSRQCSDRVQHSTASQRRPVRH